MAASRETELSGFVEEFLPSSDTSWKQDIVSRLIAGGIRQPADIAVLDAVNNILKMGISSEDAEKILVAAEIYFVARVDDATSFEDYKVVFPKSPLGLTFKKFATTSGEGADIIAVSGFQRVDPLTPGPAETTGKIEMLDQVISCNGSNLESAEFQTVIESLKSAAFPCEVGFRRLAKEAVAKTQTTGSTSPSSTADKQMEGWLEKQGHVNKNWTKRWFVLQNKCLFYYTDDPLKGGRLKGTIDLENCTIYALDDPQNLYCFTVQSVQGSTVKAFPIKARSDIMRDCWVNLIRFHGTDALMAGWVTKKGHIFPSWKKRWTVLEGSTMYYFTSPAGELKGTIYLDGAKIIGEKDRKSFRIQTANGQPNYAMKVASERECTTWIQKCTSAATNSEPGENGQFDADFLSTRTSSGDRVNIPASGESGGSSDTSTGVPETGQNVQRQAASNKVETAVKTFSLDDTSISLKDFNLLKVVGRGAFGKVMMAQKKTGDNAGKIYAIKVLIKSDIVIKKQVENTIAERNILIQMRHPFIVCLRYSFESKDKLYLVTDYYNGGAMFFHVRKNKGFDEERTKFYAAELMLAIAHLHEHGIIYRDMKLENILMDHRGHIALTDFGLSKANLGEVFSEELTTFCGTAEYIAPELIKSIPYSAAVDWWSFGILVFEMRNVRTPFFDRNRKVSRNILTALMSS